MITCNYKVQDCNSNQLNRLRKKVDNIIQLNALDESSDMMMLYMLLDDLVYMTSNNIANLFHECYVYNICEINRLCYKYKIYYTIDK